MHHRSRRRWSRPALVVLVRYEPEEAVLAACKTDGYGPRTSPHWYNENCKPNYNCNAECALRLPS